MNFRRQVLALLSSCLLISCQHSPVEFTVHVPTPELPPAGLLAPCRSQASDGTIGMELERLSALAQCERDSKTAIKAWEAGFNVNDTAKNGIR